MSESSVDAVRFVFELSENQTSASMIYHVTRDPNRTAAILRASGAPEPECREIEEAMEICSRLRKSAVQIKWLNSILFNGAVLVLLIGTLWPAVNSLWIGLPEDLVEGLTQSGVLLLGGVVLALYGRNKARQTRREGLMRHILFSSGTLGSRIELARRALDAKGAHDSPRLSTVKSLQEPVWRFPDTATLESRINPNLEAPLTADQALVIAVQMFDAGIKYRSYRILARISSALFGVSVLLGLVLPLLATNSPFVREFLGTGEAQSLLVVGLGGLFYGIRKTYRGKLHELQRAWIAVVRAREPFESKRQHLPAVLLGIDTGLARNGRPEWWREGSGT